jgi:stage II sporulation protein M
LSLVLHKFKLAAKAYFLGIALSIPILLLFKDFAFSLSNIVEVQMQCRFVSLYRILHSSILAIFTQNVFVTLAILFLGVGIVCFDSLLRLKFKNYKKMDKLKINIEKYFVELKKKKIKVLIKDAFVLTYISPLTIIFLNGFFLGLILGVDYMRSKIIVDRLLDLIPHGMIEVPTFFLAAAFSISFSYKFLKNKNEIEILNTAKEIVMSKNTLKKFLILCFLLFIAAIVEIKA